jgi:hypothetical protein
MIYQVLRQGASTGSNMGLEKSHLYQRLLGSDEIIMEIT